MQSTLSLRDFSASICVDGLDLPYYGLEFDDETHTATCWIPSSEGKEYSVWWRQDEIRPTTAGFIFVDGNLDKSVAGRYLELGMEVCVKSNLIAPLKLQSHTLWIPLWI